MQEFHHLLLLLGVGAAAGFINVNAGGGSTLTLPVLIFLGLDPSTANGTNRIAILFQNIMAVSSFHREKFSDFKFSLRLSLVTLPGAAAGALLAVRISGSMFQKILGLVMIGIVISMICKPRFKAAAESTGSCSPESPLIYPLLFLAGVYGGFIQVGVGFVLMGILCHLLNLSLVRVNMHKVFIVLIYTLPALAIFIITKHVHWLFGLCLAAGNVFGAWLGTKAAVKKGDKAVKYVLAVSILIMSAKLLGLFELIF